MTTASTGSEYPCLNVTTNGIENTGSMELAEVYYRDTSGVADGVYVSGDFAYVADRTSGLAVIDISDPTNPSTPFYRNTSGSARSVYVSGDYAYIADGDYGLAVIDISNPHAPGTPVYEDTSGYARGVFVSGNYAYVADYYSGLAVIDISDPTNLSTPVYKDTSGSAHGVFVSGNYAYVADYISGLAVIDISDPTNPGTPVYENTSVWACGVYVSGDYAYVANGNLGLAVIDISDPTNPGTPVSVTTNGWACDVYVSGDYAYVADGSPGLAVIDISDPTNPGSPVHEDTSGYARSVYVSGDYAYVADEDSGLAVIQTSVLISGSTTTTPTTTTATTGTFTPTILGNIMSMLPTLAVFGLPLLIGAYALRKRTKVRKQPVVPVTPRPRVRSEYGKPATRVERPAVSPPVYAPMEAPKKGVSVLRGCEAVGGRFEYKVKVKNDSDYVINNVTVNILAYPQDCMTLSGESTKTISRLEISGFRSPQFIFTPTKDCVEGTIVATVSYIDHKDKAHSLQVEPYVIRSVCDLLKPLEATMGQFESLLVNMSKTSEEHSLQWNPQVLFERAKTLLPARNFYVVDEKSETIGGLFQGNIIGFAEGKYTGKKVAVRMLISGPLEGNEAKVRIDGLGDDIAMLPTSIEEIAGSIDSWTCLNCGGYLETSEVSQLKAGVPIQCRYCGHSLTIDLYRR